MYIFFFFEMLFSQKKNPLLFKGEYKKITCKFDLKPLKKYRYKVYKTIIIIKSESHYFYYSFTKFTYLINRIEWLKSWIFSCCESYILQILFIRQIRRIWFWRIVHSSNRPFGLQILKCKLQSQIKGMT